MGGGRPEARRAQRPHLRGGRRDQPEGRPGRALRGRHQPAHRPARRGLLGLLLRRRREGGRAASSPRRCCRPRCSPRPTCRTWRRSCRPSTSSRSRAPRRSPSTCSARSSSSRSTSTSASSRPCRSEYDPVALRELFSPGFLEWTTTMTGEVDFGVNDRQLWFLWRLRRAQRAGAEGGAEERRPALQADPGRDGRERDPHLPAGPLARRAGAVPGRTSGSGRVVGVAGEDDPVVLGGADDLRQDRLDLALAVGGERLLGGRERAAATRAA